MGDNVERETMAKSAIVVKEEELVQSPTKGNDAAHAFRATDLALSSAREEGFVGSRQSMLTVELAALLHDIVCARAVGTEYTRDPSEGKIVENFLVKEGVDECMKTTVLSIIKGWGSRRRLV